MEYILLTGSSSYNVAENMCRTKLTGKNEKDRGAIMRRVVVTGMGAVTPIGIGVEAFWENVKKNDTGIW